MSPLEPKRRWRLVGGGILLTLLLAAVFTLGSLDVPFEPKDALTLFAVSTFVTAAFVVFFLILARTLLRLWAERSNQQLGARFKTKMVLGAIVISLLPVIFMFFVSYSLLNRTLSRWFPRPLEIASEQSRGLLGEMGQLGRDRLTRLASQWGPLGEENPLSHLEERAARCQAADAFWFADAGGKIGEFHYCWHDNSAAGTQNSSQQGPPVFQQTLPNGAEIWRGEGALFLAGRSRTHNGLTSFAAREVPSDYLTRLTEIQRQSSAYEQEKKHLKALKTQLILILFLFTLLLIFGVLWMALFLAKQVTVPIQALAEGTREVSSGNFEYLVAEQAQDELGVLIRSFNAMTTQLRDNRQQIDEFTSNLQQAVQELERRRQLIETILENVPTGVVSVDSEGSVLRTNSATGKILGSPAREARTLDELMGQDAARAVQDLMRRSQRMGVVSREIEMIAQGRVLHAAVTVSSLGPRRAHTGYVVVLDDVTELLRAQKSAAWQEVAQRIAHEIKNPLTPIQLSAQRLERYLERREQQADGAHSDPELTRLVQECSRLISQEVASLAALVDEFSQFVRFPTARLASTDANEIARQSVEVFAGRLEGITLETRFEANLPAVRGDANLLRSVLVNLIDNAAEALENSSVKKIRVLTRAHPDAETIEICVEDTGHGISPEDKDKLFLPSFSTKDRGTGLGLAIAARIVAEHGGKINVEDNQPVGSRFFVELPVAESVLTHPAERSRTSDTRR